MIRTQVYLDKGQVQEIAVSAKKQKVARAKVIRALVQKGIEAEKREESVGEAFLDLAELGKKLKLTGPTNISTEHDKYLYED